jgi:rhodanese-related sulfurtransferase/DNA-binding transcriptional ArsR family regulator
MSSRDTSRSPKRTLYGAFAEVAKALGHAHRLELLEHAGQGERSVEALAQCAGLSTANASQHLLQLRRAGLLTSRRDGKNVLYRLADDTVLLLLSALRRIAERNVAEAQQVIATYFQDRDALEPVSRKELARRLKDRSVTVLDVRPPDEFAMGHIAGAVNVPLKDLTRRIESLSRQSEVIAYCRGPYCVLAFEAVALLRQCGFTVRRLEDGYPEWRAAGLPVA